MFDYDYFSRLVPWYERLKNCGNPIFIYGMGDGCEKVLSAFRQHGIKASGIFASDDFAREQQFAGFDVRSLSDIESEYQSFTIAMAFGTSLPDIMERIDGLSSRHTLIYPDTPVIGDEYFTKEIFLEKFSLAQKVYGLLADSQSQKVFKNVLSFKITGDISFLKEIFTQSDEAYENILMLSDNEIYMDLGAYTGDTIAEFLSHTGGSCKAIYALEPNKKNFRKCVKNTIGLDNVFLYNSPAWECDTFLNFSSGAGRQAQIIDSGSSVWARSVDSILSGGEASYIKYDVEGSDRCAILGSEKTIKKYSPKICTALYHRAYDIIELPLLINSINPGYKLYMRQYPYYPAWETNLFAI